MGRLDGKVALISGAARGTGETTARLFAKEGARVVVGDILRERGEEVVKDVGANARFVPLDVTDERSWAEAMRQTVAEFGALNVLVNNAAVLDVAAIDETTLDNFTRVLHVNVIGTFLGVRAAIEPMKAAGGGSIVNVGSIDSLETHNGLVAYSASKWGVRSISKTAAIELGQYNIRVNTVCPGPGNPQMIQPFVEQAIARMQKTGEPPGPMPLHPAARRGEMIDVARAILYLASDESDYVSGTDLAVDGGGTAGKVMPGAPGAPRPRG